jgi:hypothetical protein
MMEKKTLLILAASAALSFGITAKANADTQMQRLYNPNSGEHFYTAKTAEKDNLITAGWTYEGTGWVAPDSGAPVYRLYNPNAGDHFYTLSAFERDSLVKVGWNDEGIGWYSGGSIALQRAYNPNVSAGSHNYTTSTFEQENLVKVGWRDEGTAWYGVGMGTPVTPAPTAPSTGGQYYVSDSWAIAAKGMVFIHKDSGLAYTRVKNPENYAYVAWTNQTSGNGNGSAQFDLSDIQ